jgi:hypothetical protein
MISHSVGEVRVEERMGRIGLGLMIAALALPGGARAGIAGNWIGTAGGPGGHPGWVRFTGRMILAQFGCVMFDVKYVVHGHALQHLGDPVETENGCNAAQRQDEASMGAWRRAEQTLKAADSFRIVGDRLTLSSPDHGELVLVRQAEPPHARPPSSMVSELTHRSERASQCFSTRVRRVENRLQEGIDGPFIPGSGSVLRMTDGHYIVDENQVKAMDRSRRGDRIRMCVRSLPANCPPGDTRGIVYRVRDVTTGLRWTSGDSEHSCGGA